MTTSEAASKDSNSHVVDIFQFGRVVERRGLVLKLKVDVEQLTRFTTTRTKVTVIKDNTDDTELDELGGGSV